MKICMKCKKEMVCVKTGVICRWGKGHCYAGDRYGCTGCGQEVVFTNSNSFHSTKEIPPELLIQMD